MTHDSQPFEVLEEAPSDNSPWWLKVLKHGMIPLAVFVSAVVVTVWLLQTAPQSKRRKQAREASYPVVVQMVKTSQQRIIVEAMGTVVPAREIILYPRVRGQIISMDKELQPGGLFSRNRILMRLDPIDYQLAFRQRQNELARAEAELQVEMGKQWVAEREFKMLGKTVPQKNRDLMLRQPQLAIAKSAVHIAKAALEKARVDLYHTSLRAPFDAVVSTVDVNLGSQVAETSRLVRLIGTHEYWVILSLPVDQLRWFSIPQSAKEQGSVVRIYNSHAWGKNNHRIGRVIRLNPTLESQGRMAQVLVAIQDPLAQKAKNATPKPPRLLLDSYVQARIEGHPLPPVVTLANEYLHNDHVWVMNENRRLEIRKVRILYRGVEHSLLSSGLQDGEKIVTSSIPIPVPGMLLRTGSTKKKTQAKNNNRHRSSHTTEANK